ncbi:GntR family transcriptional regulator, partial [Klebsiella pneumoniae]
QIRSGELQPGETLQAERTLAERWGISRGTAVRALDALVAEGLVTPGNTRAGRKVRDMRVLPIHASLTEQMERRKAAGVDAWVADTQDVGRTPGQSIDVGVVQADEEIVRWLEVPADAPVAVRRRLRTLDGEPNNRADTYYPMDIAQAIPEILDPSDVTQGVLALMAERGYVTEHYVDALRWRPPTPEEAQMLRIGQGVSVLIQARTGYMDGQPLHLTRTVWPGNTVELRYELPA